MPQRKRFDSYFSMTIESPIKQAIEIRAKESQETSSIFVRKLIHQAIQNDPRLAALVEQAEKEQAERNRKLLQPA
jgi:hypothetical protein